VCSSVDLLEALTLECLGPFRELFIEGSLIFFLQFVIVFLDMDTEDVLFVFLNTEDFLSLSLLFSLLTSLVSDDLSLLNTETWESLLRVRNVETTVAGTLHGSENTVSSGGADETNIEESLEWTLVSVVDFGNLIVASINLVVTLEFSVEILHLKESTSTEKSSGVSRGVVGESSSNSISGKLARISRTDSLVSLNG